MIYQELLRRHVNPEAVKVWIDYENNLATFPLYGVSGRLLGYQRYNPNSTDKKQNALDGGRYFTYQTGEKLSGEWVVWGLDQLSDDRTTLYLTEGIFEAARLLSTKHNAVAILGSCPPLKTITQLYGLGFKRLVWCGDNDKAGRTSGIIKMVDSVLHFDVDLDEVEENELLDALELDKL